MDTQADSKAVVPQQPTEVIRVSVENDTHTPGPWHVFPGRPGIFNNCDVVVSEHVDDAIVCAMGHDLRGIDANARLIAAAPELLAALIKAEEFFDSHGTPEPSDLLATLRAAIAKAEGR